MAEKKTEKKTEAVKPSADRVTIHINRIPGQKVQDDVVLSVNGERFQIQRGVDVSVPIRVAKAFQLWQKECEEAERIEYELMEG